ncbi:Pentalenene oxygenase [Enhygromyxa salina]|uniref:Pentalenene oxygenase n=1 Tax=Enhygromyxa salina TaxID=215803 RepID=A0A2S9YET9_9BACT|nr:cytochrome P450 [Enhygromyxa salina]PRQ03617.1 Pentalenene oxygenase [Enhygromyxa salina]
MGAWAQLRALRRDFLGYLLDAARLGDLVLLRPAPGVKIWLVNHPELIFEVLVSRAAEMQKSAMTNKMVGKFLGQGLVLAEGELHRQQRRAIQPAFRGSVVAALSPAIEAATTAATRSWRDGQAVEIEGTMTRLSLLIIAQLLFGEGEGARGGTDASLQRAMERFGESMAQRFRSMPLPNWLPTARRRAERAAIEVFDHAIAKHLETSPSDSLATKLLALGLAPAEIRDHIATLYFAGHETTAKWLTWTLWLIARDPELGERLRDDESDALLNRVLLESLRLYPPAWLFDRETTTELELGGYAIPKRSTLYLSPFVSHRDPRYFDAPDQFCPERFVGGFEASLPRGAYYPFGFGPRNCVGRPLAELTARVALRDLLKRWRFSVDPKLELRPQPASTLRPTTPLYLTIHPH